MFIATSLLPLQRHFQIYTGANTYFQFLTFSEFCVCNYKTFSSFKILVKKMLFCKTTNGLSSICTRYKIATFGKCAIIRKNCLSLLNYKGCKQVLRSAPIFPITVRASVTQFSVSCCSRPFLLPHLFCPDS
jgi:hypothetical protein